MTQDEIIRMAREAGIKESDVVVFRHFPFEFYQLERFAALVAAHAKQEYIDSVYEQHRETMFSNKDLGMLVDAVKAEREACAKVCEEGTGEAVQKTTLEILLNERKRIAKAIRDRGEK